MGCGRKSRGVCVCDLLRQCSDEKEMSSALFASFVLVSFSPLPSSSYSQLQHPLCFRDVVAVCDEELCDGSTSS